MDDLELIKQKINIVDLIQEYLPLKKTGVNFKANCPFHSEKTPSFVVSPDRGIWHCFGCQKGGDHFRFIMEKEGVDFPEALEILAQKAGVTLQKSKGGVKDKRSRIFETNQKASEFYQYVLKKHDLGKKALDYLKSRGLSDETIQKFGIGYAPNSWESLTKFLMKRGFKMEEIITSGLAVTSSSGGYDRFRGRIIFPLIDTKNQIVGFSGRILGVGEPKYINSPQTPVFDKSNYLFGLNLAKAEIRNKNQAILVEGEMDMILSFQAGVKNVVASKGTALTSSQIELIKKYTETIYLCFDHDIAGDTASRRGIEMADQAGLSMKVIKISGGKDPAELINKNPEDWNRAVEDAEPIYDYYISSSVERFNIKTADGKKQVASETLPIISKITDSLSREHYLQKLSALLSMPEQILRQEINKKNSPAPEAYKTVLKQSDQAKVGFKTRRELLEEYLLVLLLKIPSNLTYVPNFPETIFISESYRSIYVLLVVYLDSVSFNAKSFQIDDFVKTLPPDLQNIADRLYLTEIDDKLTVSKEWKGEIEVVVMELKKALIKASLERLSAEIKNAETFGKIDTLTSLNKRFRDLALKLKNL